MPRVDSLCEELCLLPERSGALPNGEFLNSIIDGVVGGLVGFTTLTRSPITEPTLEDVGEA